MMLGNRVRAPEGHLKIAQQFTAGTRIIEEQSVKSRRDDRDAEIQPSLRDGNVLRRPPYPAMNRWAIIDRPFGTSLLIRVAQSALFLVLCFLPALCPAQPRTEDVTFTARCDGSKEHYVLLYPPGFKADRPHDLLVCLHGHGSDRWQYIKDPRDETRVARDVAAAHGMLFVSPDYRACTSWMGPKAEADMLQILKELKARFKIGKVVLCGGSMGGSSVLTFAALHPKLVHGVVSMNGTANHVKYDKFQDAIAASFGGSKQQVPGEYKKRSAEYWPERFTMPLGITAGGKDQLVPADSVLRLAEAVRNRQSNVLVVYRVDGGHSTNYEDGKAVLEFVIVKAIKPLTPSPSPAKGEGSDKEVKCAITNVRWPSWPIRTTPSSPVAARWPSCTSAAGRSTSPP
jgi:pimeloyl-ACP methyl ester carboxylesterase